MFGLQVLGEHEHARLRVVPPYRKRCLQPFVRVRRRHPDVGDGHVGSLRFDQLDELGSVGAAPHHLEPGILQDPGQPLPEQHRIVCDHDTHGSSATIVVPARCGLFTVNRPPTAATRSASPRSPDPVAVAPPRPSSRTSRRRTTSR